MRVKLVFLLVRDSSYLNIVSNKRVKK